MLSASVTISDFLIFSILGLICGFGYDILKVIKNLFKNNIFIVNIIDFCFVVLCGFCFIFCIFKFEYGSFKLFEIISFIFGIIFEQIIVEILFTSPIKWVYNKIKLARNKKDFLLN